MQLMETTWVRNAEILDQQMVSLKFLGDKHTLFGLFRHVYRSYTVGNGVFLATRQRCFQQYNHEICAGTIQTVYVYPHSNALR